MLTTQYHERLESWGCKIVPPRVDEQQVTMAEIEQIVAAILGG